ncbi:MAG: L-serine ammonia-lyase, iron-sulfur-dependent, subunit alpha [Oscillospiraceae bacterium]
MFKSILELVKLANEKNFTIGDIVLAEEVKNSKSTQKILLDRMLQNIDIMKKSSIIKNTKSFSGLSGDNAYTYENSSNKGKLLSPLMTNAITKAMAIAEENARMGTIVASPTAGSCGIIPGSLLSFADENNVSDEKVARALFNCAGIGMVIAKKATLSGAEGGCQAECGSAAAMAASALVELSGGSPSMCSMAVAFALKSVLGLVCDPVCGFVEVPCIKRNASGVVNAISSAEMALCGMKSMIPADEVIEAMAEVGKLMNYKLKETAIAGLAGTKTAQKIKEVGSDYITKGVLEN